MSSCIISKEDIDPCNKNKINLDAQNVQLSKNDIIKRFDNKYKEDEEKQLRKEEQRSASIQNSEKSFSDEENKSSESDNGSYKNGHGTNGSTPPKPLPRTSRNNSVSEQGTVLPEDTSNGSRPVARPRTAATYKVDKIHLLSCMIYFSLFCFYNRFGCFVFLSACS